MDLGPVTTNIHSDRIVDYITSEMKTYKIATMQHWTAAAGCSAEVTSYKCGMMDVICDGGAAPTLLHCQDDTQECCGQM